MYSDIGLLTCDRDIAADVAAFFNLLTGYSEQVGWAKLAMAPIGLRQKFLDLIEREIQVSTPDRPGLILAKCNSLQDPEIIRALYRASKAGVKIQLNIRGICCLRPGVRRRFRKHPGPLDHRSLLGARAGVLLPQRRPRGSLSQQRRLDAAEPGKRLEILFPVGDPNRRRRLIHALETCFADNQKAWRLLAETASTSGCPQGPQVRAQQKFYKKAVDAARTAAHAAPQFRPLTRPKR